MSVDMDCQARLNEVVRMGLDAIGLVTQRAHSPPLSPQEEILSATNEKPH